jgi:hypothetical protein
MDSIRVSEALDSGSIPDETTKIKSNAVWLSLAAFFVAERYVRVKSTARGYCLYT